MRIFGSDKLDGMLQRLGLKENEAIVHSWINKALEKAQQKVEARNFDIRKNLLKFDNVMNDQRKVIFEQRIEWMRDEAVHEIVADMRHAAIEDLVARHLPHNSLPEQWDIAGLDREMRDILTLAEPLDDWTNEDGMTVGEMCRRLTHAADQWMAAKDAKFGDAGIRHMQRMIVLHALDNLWREHLVTLEALRRAIGWRSYGRRQPLTEYKTEALHLFETMLRHLDAVVTALTMRVGIVAA
jgi:preprotein translocase subunit SecA